MEEPEELTQRDSEEDSPSQSTESNFMHQYSMAELRQHQLEDPNLSPVIGWIESGQSPSEAELLLQSVCTKHYWHCRNQLKIIDGVLFYIWDKGTVTRDLLVIPRSLKGDIIKMFHDTPIGGHLGRDKNHCEDKAESLLVWADQGHRFACRHVPRMQQEQAFNPSSKSTTSMFPGRISRGPRSSGHAGPFFYQWIWKQVCVDDHRSIHTMARNGPATFTRCQVGCESIFRELCGALGGAVLHTHRSRAELWECTLSQFLQFAGSR